MRSKNSRIVLSAVVLTLVLSAVAAFALQVSPPLSPSSVVMSTNTTLKFNVAKSNNRVWEKWMIIANATGSSIDQNGNFTAGPNPGTVYISVTTGDYGADHPSIAQITITAP